MTEVKGCADGIPQAFGSIAQRLVVLFCNPFVLCLSLEIPVHLDIKQLEDATISCTDRGRTTGVHFPRIVQFMVILLKSLLPSQSWANCSNSTDDLPVNCLNAFALRCPVVPLAWTYRSPSLSLSSSVKRSPSTASTVATSASKFDSWSAMS